MSATFERELGQAMRVAREAGALLKENFGKSQEVEYKGRIDLVTEMDHRSEELIIGATNEGGATRDFGAMLINVLGAKFKIVTGYAGSNEIMKELIACSL